MDIGVIGAGYVGLVQAIGLAELGHRVRVAEVDVARRAKLEEGILPIYEAGLEEMFAAAVGAGLISIHADNCEVVSESELSFLCLPTPAGVEGVADIGFVQRVLEELANGVGGRPIVVIKSTIPVGTTARFIRRFGDRLVIAHNPEFLSEGTAVKDFLEPSRIVIGSDDPAVADKIAATYVGMDAPRILTDPTSAELIKYGSNCYLATRLTYVNALANIAESVGADVLDVVRGMGLDPRIGPRFLQPGPGYGGSCFPKDTIALLATARQAGYEFSLLQSVVDADRSQRLWITGNIRRMVDDDLSGANIALWGTAFKAGTDDSRESAAVKIAQSLIAGGAMVTAHDPRASISKLRMAPDPVECARDADIVVVATEWPEYRSVDFAEVAKIMRGDMVYDLRNLLDAAVVRRAGLSYRALGRPRI